MLRSRVVTLRKPKWERPQRRRMIRTMGEAQHFERGQNWRAKNINSIKLDIKGKKHPVEVRRVEAMSDEQAAAATARRQATKRVLETEQADRKRREVRRIAAMKADVDHAEEGHTPEGWVPASRRGFVDPFSVLDP